MTGAGPDRTADRADPGGRSTGDAWGDAAHMAAPGGRTDALGRLLRPRRIAVIGGGSWCANVVRECERIGFSGELWPVHPHRATVGGRPAVTRIDDLPAPPDAAFVGVNRAATVEVVAALARLGAGGAVCFASGFREAAAELADGAALQEALVAAAGEMPILGPNCYGFVNAIDGAALWPDQHGLARVEAGVALVTQSSNIAINLTMQRRGLPLAYVVTVGNQAQTGLAQIGAALLADPQVTALGLHVEGVGDLRALEALAAQARALGKPIVALKVGMSAQAQAATVSHTASLAGSGAAGRALLARLGIAQVDSLAVLIETLKILHVTGPLSSARIASLSCSGGEASLMADTGLAAGVSFPALDDGQTRRLRAVLGPRVALANPLDYHTYIWNDRAAMTACFRAIQRPDLAMACVVLDFPRADRCTADEWHEVVVALTDAARPKAPRDGQPLPAMALIASLPENLPEPVAQHCLAHGVVPLCGLPEALSAIAAAAWLGAPRPVAAPLWLPPPSSTPAPAKAQMTKAASPTAPGSPRLWTEDDAKTALAAHGLRVPQRLRAATPDEAGRAAAQLGGPVALKGEGLAHKSDSGAVVLNLTDPEDVRRAAARIEAPGFLVEEMVSGAVAELLVGVLRDPAHGWLLTLAAGGVDAEWLADRAFLLLPASDAEILAALDSLRIGARLRGWRGAPPADRSAILAAIHAIARYVAATPGLIEIEVNPLLCRADGAIAVDALIRTEAP